LPQIEVTFDIDANGILSVKAQDKGTGKEQHITITASTSLNKDEIEKMKKDAEANAESDKKKKESIEIKNMAETLYYTTEKATKEAGDKLPEADKKTINEKMEALKAVKDGEDLDAIKKATEELSTEAQKIGQVLYNKQETVNNKQGTNEEEKKDEKEEGEFEEVKKGEVKEEEKK